jgi:hypothetical protein
MRATLDQADLVYANLEGLLVESVGPKIDIPDKPQWTHPGPNGVKALKAANIAVVGVANNVASGRDDILESLAVLDANGIAHIGAGRNSDEAHKPVIVERKGVRIGFLQYTARWYQETDMLATPTEAGVAKIASIDGLTIDPADLERVRHDIKALRSRADIVIVSHHNRDGATPVQFGGKATEAAWANPRWPAASSLGSKNETWRPVSVPRTSKASATFITRRRNPSRWTGPCRISPRSCRATPATRPTEFSATAICRPKNGSIGFSS